MFWETNRVFQLHVELSKLNDYHSNYYVDISDISIVVDAKAFILNLWVSSAEKVLKSE